MKTYSDIFKENHPTALIPFLVLGDPDQERSLELIKTVIDAGADILELGIPLAIRLPMVLPFKRRIFGRWKTA